MVTPQNAMAGVSRTGTSPASDAPIKGFSIAQPAVPGSTSPWKNVNPFTVRVYVTGVGSGITAVTVTDANGNSVTMTTTVAIGWHWDLEPGSSIALTYTGSPTWKTYGFQPGGY